MAFARYDECGGQLNPKKCHLAQLRVKLLGHVISENGIEADPEKVEALLLLSSPYQTAGYFHSKGEIYVSIHTIGITVNVSIAARS